MSNIKSGDLVEAGDLYNFIYERASLNDESFKFKVLGGRKTYGYISAAWGPVSNKYICIAEKFNNKNRWISRDIKLQIL